METTLTKKVLVLKYEVFSLTQDKNVFTTQKFSNLKTTSSNASLKAVGDALAPLVDSSNVFIRKEENYLFD